MASSNQSYENENISFNNAKNQEEIGPEENMDLSALFHENDNTAFNMTKLQEEIGPVENNKSSCK